MDVASALGAALLFLRGGVPGLVSLGFGVVESPLMESLPFDPMDAGLKVAWVPISPAGFSCVWSVETGFNGDSVVV